MLSPQELRYALTDPREIVKDLGKYIIGQESAKKALAILAMNRSMMLLSKFGLFGKDRQMNIHKTNVLLIGPTGSGKSSIVTALSKVMDMPITKFDCTSITEAGYIGSKVEDILVRYVDDFFSYWGKDVIDSRYRNVWADPDYPEDKVLLSKKMFETGIIFIDEIDKIASRGGSQWKGKDEHIQNELLKFLEGSVVDITSHHNSSSRRGKSEITSVNTEDLFFILGGAFQGLDDIIRDRLNKKAGIGFNADLPNRADDIENMDLMAQVTTDDLIEYGFKPEFVGRIPVRVSLNGMTKDVLMDIIRNSEESPFNRYQNFFHPFGVYLAIDDSGIEAIADLALKLNTGARALNNIFHQILEPSLLGVYDLPQDILTINREMVERANHNEI